MMRFSGENTKLPKKAKEASIQGRVYTQVIIDKQGLVSDVTIKKSVSPELDVEAIRVVSSMPKWKPGEKDEKKVNVSYVVPLNFKLSSESKKQ